MGEQMQNDQQEVGELAGKGENQPSTPIENRKTRLQGKPTAFERRVEAGVASQRGRINSAKPSNDSPSQQGLLMNGGDKPAGTALETHLEPAALTETDEEKGGLQTAPTPAEEAPVSGPVAIASPANAGSHRKIATLALPARNDEGEESASAFSSPRQSTQTESPFAQALHLLQEIATPREPALSEANVSARNDGVDESAKRSHLSVDPKALRLLADLAELAQGGAPAAKASHVIQPSGGGLPAPDLRREYERRLGALRPGDVAGLMEVKREFRKRGLEVY